MVCRKDLNVKSRVVTIKMQCVHHVTMSKTVD